MKIIKIISLILGCTIIIFFITIGIIAIKIFIIGNLMATDRPHIDNINISDTQISIEGRFTRDSALAFRRFTYRIDGDSLYIKIYYVLCSDVYRSGNFNIYIKNDYSNIKNMYLEDKDNRRLLWHKEANGHVTEYTGF